MKSFEVLRLKEKETLLKYPAYISLLAANRDGKLDEEEKSRPSGFLISSSIHAIHYFSIFIRMRIGLLQRT
ncbi:hypothetical protein OCK74_09185 [Chitinophagaceae bacterium LB-8]|uniref:Uncharacterized protein n=1 Tax=Paraflavisolibacter caeni TaxID=2982496 RepID=A0A9X2XU63_9BACT|nr:hypothetical protein [Paraflavisolibacter caeni]MCU7549289.1 hypothetical protein [Paraflavisolibacter caeni]